MLRRYSLGQNSAPVSTSPPMQPLHEQSISMPTSNPHNMLRRASEGQSSTSTATRGARLAPLRAAAASVFGPNRSTTSSDAVPTPPLSGTSPTPSASNPSSGNDPSHLTGAPSGDAHRLRLVPFLDMTRSLLFVPTVIELRENGNEVQLGRFSERRRGTNPVEDADTTNQTTEVNIPSAEPSAIPMSDIHAARASASIANRQQTRLTFKSKVVSRLHAEIWCEAGGKVYIRDTKSSSGTFLNHVRLSPPGVLSRAFPLKDGDVLQLGIDYQGGAQELYRCIKLRIELDHNTQLQPTAYGISMLQQLQSIQDESLPETQAESQSVLNPQPAEIPDLLVTAKNSDQPTTMPASENLLGTTPSLAPRQVPRAALAECCICLYKIKVCQALFIAPCSHMFHYKCIRSILSLHHPGFSCPLCRMFVNLEDDVEIDDEDDIEDARLVASSLQNVNPVGNSELHPTPRNDSTDEQYETTSDMYSAAGSPMNTSTIDPQPNTRSLNAIVEQDGGA
ncbi:hypothetical protein MPSI1_001601 [Malassezia psittaci]|uniref:SMAD/FHA domain-containing protein n=1 Tax=Malassezia psittaci TaxID=1821823 RepID=A0AAF0F8U5_9BASI|nr:hypothetical protein MPSI1_001601 [Malassezia psittaci]